MKPLRSILCIPGHRADWIEKARANNLYGADMLLLDLEDSDPAARKEEAREVVSARMLPSDGVRINSGPEWDRDMDMLEFFEGAIWVPKVESYARMDLVWGRRSVRFASEWDAARLVACVESPRGITEGLISVRSYPHLYAGLAFGKHDFIASAGLSPWQTGAIDHAAAQVALAAMARGVPCWMAPSYEQDSSKVWHEAKAAQNMGFTGMGCIAPWQVPIVNSRFGHEEGTPGYFDRHRAESLVEAFNANPTEAEAVFRTAAGDLVSPPTVAWARRVLDAR